MNHKKPNKGREIHGLHKVPDSVIIKSQQVEIGQLNSYIDELKFKLDQERKENLIKRRGLIDQCNNLVEKNKKLKKENKEYRKLGTHLKRA
jgi:hypothetical protein